MEHLTHGGDIYSLPGPEKILDFSVNVNPMGIHPDIKQAVIDCIGDCVRYPDPLCRELVSGIASWEAVPEKNILCGNGADDIIFRLVQYIKPRRALIQAPAFSEYERALRTVGCQIEYARLSEEHDFVTSEDILESIHPELDLMFVCNPNNPTGLPVCPDLMKRILDRCVQCDVLLFADECFIEFMDEPDKHTLKPYLKDNKNLFLLKSFTKLFAIPGLRLGYGIATEELINGVRQSGQEWSVSIPAQSAGLAALSLAEHGYLEKTGALIRDQREWLGRQLARFGLFVYDSAANYIFVKTREKNLKEYLITKNILIRCCGNYQGLSNEYYRFAVLDAASNQRLVQVLEEALAKKEIDL